jgi:hypothetical protein
MSSTDLMAAFDAAVMTPAGTVDAYNAAITTFLRDQGYTCAALEVLAAFKAMRDKTLAYWTGSYTTWLIDDGGVCYANSSLTPRAAAGTTPVPVPGPPLVVTPEGVTLDGTAIANLSYNDNELTWSGSDNVTSATLQLGTVTRGTLTDSFTGAECFGTITYPDAGTGAHHGTCSLYARVSGSAGEPGSTDGKSYTLACILGALGMLGLLAALGLYRFVSARRQAELARAARDERDAGRAGPEEGDTGREEGTGREYFSEVTSEGRFTESRVINRANARLRAAAARRSLEETARYEVDMSLADRGRLATAAREVRTAEDMLESPTAQALPDVVQTANTQLNSVTTALRQLFSSIGAKFSAQTRTQIAENSQVAEDMGKVYDDILEQREKGEPFEFEVEDL